MASGQSLTRSRPKAALTAVRSCLRLQPTRRMPCDTDVPLRQLAPRTSRATSPTRYPTILPPHHPATTPIPLISAAARGGHRADQRCHFDYQRLALAGPSSTTTTTPPHTHHHHPLDSNHQHHTPYVPPPYHPVSHPVSPSGWARVGSSTSVMTETPPSRPSPSLRPSTASRPPCPITMTRPAPHGHGRGRPRVLVAAVACPSKARSRGAPSLATRKARRLTPF